jgi:biopolymer transport protein ExbD
MGMTVGGNKGVAAEPNIVPLIDVLLVLIIIFMVIIPSDSKGLPTQVPQPAPPQATSEPEPQTIVVQVMQGGRLMINRDPSDWDRLGQDMPRGPQGKAQVCGRKRGSTAGSSSLRSRASRRAVWFPDRRGPAPCWTWRDAG